jgi:hypothetical protein
MAAIRTEDELLLQLRRSCNLDRLRYSAKRSAEMIETFAIYASYLDDLGALGEESETSVQLALESVERAGQMMLERGDMTPATYGHVLLVQDAYSACGDHRRRAAHDDQMESFRERGLHGMHRPAVLPPPSDATVCFVCCDAPPEGSATCCAESASVCAGCMQRCGACPVCRAPV